MNKLILADNYELTGFTLNGTVITFDESVDKSIFTARRLKDVQVIAENENLHFTNAELITFGETSKTFAFVSKDPILVMQEQLNAKLDYLALMSNVSLED